MIEQVAGRFAARVGQACTRYVDIQVDEGEYGGGWGLREASEPSIVNTTEVLSVLRAGGVTGSTIDEALTYLCHAIPLHCAKRERGKGRGRNTRFVTFGLLGLTEYEGRLSRGDVADTVRWALTWLEEHRHPGGDRGEQGWPESAGEEETSLFQTAMAVIALTRLQKALEQRGDSAPLPGEKDNRATINRIDLLVRHGTSALLYHRLTNGAWPRQTYADKGSPSKTSLAVLALASAAGRDVGGAPGSAEAEEWACGGALPVAGRISLGEAIDTGGTWLIENHERWQSFVEPDPDVKGTAWSHLAYALAVRACIRAGADPDDLRLEVARALIDKCWSGQDASWSEPVDRGFLATVRASYNIVLTELEVRAAYGRLGRASAPRRPRVLSVAPVADRLIVRPRDFDLIDENGLATRVAISARRLELLQLLATEDGQPSAISKDDIASGLHIAVTSVANAVAQLNRAVLNTTSGQYVRLVATVDTGYRIAVDTVEHQN